MSPSKISLFKLASPDGSSRAVPLVTTGYLSCRRRPLSVPPTPFLSYPHFPPRNILLLPASSPLEFDVPPSRPSGCRAQPCLTPTIPRCDPGCLTGPLALFQPKNGRRHGFRALAPSPPCRLLVGDASLAVAETFNFAFRSSSRFSRYVPSLSSSSPPGPGQPSTSAGYTSRIKRFNGDTVVLARVSFYRTGFFSTPQRRCLPDAGDFGAQIAKTVDLPARSISRPPPPSFSPPSNGVESRFELGPHQKIWNAS